VTHPGLARSRPVEKQFMRTGLGYDEDLAVLAWCGGVLPSIDAEDRPDHIDDSVLFYIRTLEGDMAVTIGDVVIRGVQGEFYPCKPDIFDQTYDLVEDHSL
jgi:hypothetical protein